VFSFNKGIQNVKNKNWGVGFGGAIILLRVSLLCFLVVANRGCNFNFFLIPLLQKKLIIFLYVNVGFCNMVVEKRCYLHGIDKGDQKELQLQLKQHVA
jgi:hypothetical protein